MRCPTVPFLDSTVLLMEVAVRLRWPSVSLSGSAVVPFLTALEVKLCF